MTCLRLHILLHTVPSFFSPAYLLYLYAVPNMLMCQLCLLYTFSPLYIYLILIYMLSAVAMTQNSSSVISVTSEPTCWEPPVYHRWPSSVYVLNLVVGELINNCHLQCYVCFIASHTQDDSGITQKRPNTFFLHSVCLYILTSAWFAAIGPLTYYKCSCWEQLFDYSTFTARYLDE